MSVGINLHTYIQCTANVEHLFVLHQFIDGDTLEKVAIKNVPGSRQHGRVGGRRQTGIT